VTASSPRPAVFLDRDGTIIDDTNYVADPALVRLRPTAADAIARLNSASIPVIVVTNQSGIARGLISPTDYERVATRLAALLAEHGAVIDATYMCPHHPEFGGACDCRKPGTLLFRRAAAEHQIDLARSAFIGDRWRDVAPGISLGGRPILIADEQTDPSERARAEDVGIEIVASLGEAVDHLFDTGGAERGTSY
jgi:histidinol-phosphate phosphatase family protein